MVVGLETSDVTNDQNLELHCEQGAKTAALPAGYNADMCTLYVVYPLSLRHLEEMMSERAVSVDHSTVHGWVIKLLPAIGKAFGPRKKKVGRSWRMDETYIKVKGE